MDCQNWDHPKGWIGVIISIRRPSFLGILPAAGFRRFVTTAVVTLDSLFVELQRQLFVGMQRQTDAFSALSPHCTMKGLGSRPDFGAEMNHQFVNV